MRRLLLAAALAALGPAAPAAAADGGFLREPTDQLALPGAPAGAEVTPAGALYTDATELGFRAGPPLRPWPVVPRRMLGGDRPILSSRITAGGLRYTLTEWATEVAGAPADFATVDVANPGRRAAAGRVAAGVRWVGSAPGRGGHHYRYARPPADLFAPGAVYGTAGGFVTREGTGLYAFPPAPPGGRRTRVADPPAPLAEATETGRVRYDLRVPAHGRRRLVFRLPVAPVAPGSAAARALLATSAATARATALGRWRAALRGAVVLQLPEGKVRATFYASLVHMLEGQVAAGPGEAEQLVNRLNYRAFFLRDASAIAAAYDAAGLRGAAANTIAHFARYQRADGLFISQPEQWDGLGEALWAYGRHAELTRGAAYARAALPGVARAMAWLARQQAADPTGLLPTSTSADNELVAGRRTGDDLWAVAGARAAAGLAARAGRADLAATWRAQAARLRSSLLTALGPAVARAGGRIPPVLDARGGEDWGNLWAAWPTGVLAPGDHRVTATLTHARKAFREGIATYRGGRSLHGYLGYRVFETELERGQTAAVVRGLYAELVHTTSTGGGFEQGVHPFGRRTSIDNFAPHGWWAAEYVTLLRNALVREAGARLVVLSALSPAWLRPGRTVGISGAPSALGTMAVHLRTTHRGAVLTWRRRGGPARVALRWPLPPWVRDVRVHGRRTRRTLALAGRRGRLTLTWRRTGPDLSYAATRRALVAAYRARGGW